MSAIVITIRSLFPLPRATDLCSIDAWHPDSTPRDLTSVDAELRQLLTPCCERLNHQRCAAINKCENRAQHFGCIPVLDLPTIRTPMCKPRGRVFWVPNAHVAAAATAAASTAAALAAALSFGDGIGSHCCGFAGKTYGVHAQLARC